MFSKMTSPGKKALFQVTAEAAAGLEVTSASLGIDTDNPKLQPWIPRLEIGKIQAAVGKSITINSTSKRNARALSEVSRQRLESWIPADAHRGLRMLRQRELRVNVEEICRIPQSLSPMPTRRPSISFTKFPTSQPTRQPTNDPSRRPTKKPTEKPTRQPTKVCRPGPLCAKCYS